MKICPVCGKEFKPKWDKGGYEQTCCSRTCSNTLFPRRIAQFEKLPSGRHGAGICPRCGRPTAFAGAKMCGECKINKGAAIDAWNDVYSNMTLSEFLSTHESTYGRHKHQAVRNRAIILMKYVYGDERKCAVCEYDKHIEVCHVIPIGAFAIDALMSEINGHENLLYLCPTHHWELDSGELWID